MTTLVGDFRKPVDPTALGPKGLGGALRYWTKQHGSSTVVGLTAAEIGRYRNAGVPLGTVYEDTAAGWMAGGAAAGKQAATYLLGQFKAVGWTPSSLYFADDANTISAAATNACLDAAGDVFGFKPDLYAFDTELESAHTGGHSNRSWLTGHFPGTTVAAVQASMPWLHLYQCQGSQPAGIPTTVTVSGVLGDVDIVLRPDWAGAVDVELTDPITYTDRDTGAVTKTTVGAALGAAHSLHTQLTKGNGAAGGGPAGWWVRQFLTPDHATLGDVSDKVDGLATAATGILNVIAELQAQVAALKTALPAETLTGQATVTVALNPPSA